MKDTLPQHTLLTATHWSLRSYQDQKVSNITKNKTDISAQNFFAFKNVRQTAYTKLVVVSMCEKHIQSIPARPSRNLVLKTLTLTNTRCEGEAQTVSVVYI